MLLRYAHGCSTHDVANARRAIAWCGVWTCGCVPMHDWCGWLTRPPPPPPRAISLGMVYDCPRAAPILLLLLLCMQNFRRRQLGHMAPYTLVVYTIHIYTIQRLGFLLHPPTISVCTDFKSLLHCKYFYKYLPNYRSGRLSAFIFGPPPPHHWPRETPPWTITS